MMCVIVGRKMRSCLETAHERLVKDIQISYDCRTSITRSQLGAGKAQTAHTFQAAPDPNTH